MKRQSQFCAAAALLLLLTACSNDSPSAVTEDSVTQTAPETEAVTQYELPALDYSGETFNLLSPAYVADYYTLSDEETGEPINDGRFRMKTKVEEAFNIEMTEADVDLWEMPETVRTLIMSGDTTYDAMCMMDRFALSTAMNNVFLPIQDIETIHLDEPYWGAGISSYLSINGVQYFGVGSMNLDSFNRTACILMNTKLAGQYDLTIPYDDVRAGTWTLDDLYAYNGIANQDLNGDGVWDYNDQYTYGMGDVRSGATLFWQAALHLQAACRLFYRPKN